VSKVLRPRDVNWPRALAAGLLGATLAALIEQLQDVVHPPIADDILDQPPTRYIAGLATASAYAALFYGRLPGSPLTRGLLFGGIDSLLATGGGSAAVVRQVSPRFSFPLAALAGPVSRTTLGNVAFGLGLGLMYRPPSDDADEEEEETEEEE
jgi:hypothetical protein